MGCGANCGGGGCGGGCGGCGRELWLTEGEVALLMRFAQIPIYLEEGDASLYSGLLQSLALKGLITIDYHIPLSGFDYAAYEGYPCRGSMALTAEGQRAVELLEIQGAEE